MVLRLLLLCVIVPYAIRDITDDVVHRHACTHNTHTHTMEPKRSHLNIVQLNLLHPWRVTSSGVAGIADDLLRPCFLSVVLSHFSPALSYLSHTQLSILHLAALFFFSLVCRHLAFFFLILISDFLLFVLFRSPHT